MADCVRDNPFFRRLRGGLAIAMAVAAAGVAGGAAYVAWGPVADFAPRARWLAAVLGAVGLAAAMAHAWRGAGGRAARPRRPPSQWVRWAWLAGVLLLAAGVRIAFFAVVHPVPLAEARPFHSPGDDYEYHRLAVRLLATGQFADPDDDYFWDAAGECYPLDPPQYAWRAPGYAYALAAAYAVFGARPEVGAGLNIALAVLLVWLVYELGRRLGGETAGRLAGLLAAVFPSLALWPSLLFAETLLAALVAGSLWAYAAGVAAEERGAGGLAEEERAAGGPAEQRAAWRRWVARWAAPAASGLLMGLAALTRGTVLLWPVGLAAWELAAGSRLRDLLRRGAVATAMIGLTVLPWLLRNQAVLGRFPVMSTNSGGNYYGALTSEQGSFNAEAWTKLHGELTPQTAGRGYELARSDTGWRWARAILAADPGRPWRQAPAKFRMFWELDDQCVYWSMQRNSPQFEPQQAAWRMLCDGAWMVLVTWLAGAAAGRMIGGLLRREGRGRGGVSGPRRRLILLPATFCLYLCGIHLLFESQDRYHVTLTPLLIVLAAVLTCGRRTETTAGTASA